MRPHAPLAVIFALLPLLPGGFAQTKTRFSSAYTDMNTQCKPQGNPNDPNGGDAPLLCKGYNGYTVSVSYSAFAASLSAEKASGISVPLAEVEGDYDAQKGRKLEWRLANGVAFALILRVNTYRPAPDADNPYQAKYRTGTLLKVVGLAGFERVSGEVDVRQPNANQKARAMADAGYGKK